MGVADPTLRGLIPLHRVLTILKPGSQRCPEATSHASPVACRSSRARVCVTQQPTVCERRDAAPSALRPGGEVKKQVMQCFWMRETCLLALSELLLGSETIRDMVFDAREGVLHRLLNPSRDNSTVIAMQVPPHERHCCVARRRPP